MAYQGVSGIPRIIKAMANSSAGLIAAFQHEAAFRQELVLVLVVTPLAFWVGESAVEKVLLVSSLILILIVELINSAIESTVDRIGSEQHELSGRAKDIASAAVFLALVNAAIIWFIILVF